MWFLIISASHKLVQFMRQDEGQKKMSTTAPGCVHARLLQMINARNANCSATRTFFFLINSEGIGSFQKWNIFSEVKAIQNCTVVQTTVVWVILFSNCMVIKFIITWRHYEIKILDSRVTAACIRTSVKAPNCSQEDNAHPSTRNSGMSEQDTHLRHSSHPHTEGGEVETLRNKAAVHILLVLSMLTLWYRAGSCSVPPSLHLLIIQQNTDPFPYTCTELHM